jgi:hypothetical protein
MTISSCLWLLLAGSEIQHYKRIKEKLNTKGDANWHYEIYNKFLKQKSKDKNGYNETFEKKYEEEIKKAKEFFWIYKG